MTEQDIRWIQRLNSYQMALESLAGDVELATERDLSDMERRGLIQAFEYTYELAWKVIKDFYQAAGETNIQGSRDAFRMALNRGLVNDDALMNSIKSRQLTSHSYNKATAEEIYHDIINQYYPVFEALAENLRQQKKSRGL